jgi:hypothetical protein
MDKVLIQVYVPVLNRTFDIFIPKHSSMHEILELVKRAVQELSDGSFCPNENTTLCRREDGTIININLSVFELNIQNGTKLMLI